MISMIVAAADNNAIGKDNQLLWHLPNDLRFFKNTTWGMPVIMGRKTFEAVNKPLAGRINIVITTKPDWSAPGVIVTHNLDEALAEARKTNGREIFIIGGGEIYRQGLAITQRIYLTRVHASPQADTFFPEINETEWTLSDKTDFMADEKHLYDYSIQVWDRKQ